MKTDVTTATGSAGKPFATRSRRRRRAAAVGLAAGAALAVWAVAGPLLGMDLQTPVFDPAQGSWDVTAASVVLTAGLAGLAGWGSLAALERVTHRARRVWTTIAVLAAVVSLSMPLSGTGISAANRAVLMAMHVAVAAVLIPLLVRTSQTGQRTNSFPEGA